MGLRDDYQRIGELVGLCATTMRRLSVEKRKQGIECPFRPIAYELEALSLEISEIVTDLPAEWDVEDCANIHS